MRGCLTQEYIYLSALTTHRYMHEMGLCSIVRKKKPAYVKGLTHKIFANLLQQDFTAPAPNRIWATDFTYMVLSNGKRRYNCSIIDLYDCSIVATQNSSHIDAALAIETLKKALEQQKLGKGVILHSDQGSQFTSEEFTKFCKKHHVQQSMIRAGCPYDNAPMERFFNALKHEYINLHHFKTEFDLDTGLYHFIYVKYNQTRPHSYNHGLPPSKARKVA